MQLNLSTFNFNVISTPSDDIEAYIPDVGAITGESLADRQRMSSYIKDTTEALLLNQEGMPMDGADDFTSQLLTPISTYNEIIVHGGLREWVNFLNQKNLPEPAKAYQTVIEERLRVEYGNIEALKKMLK